LIEPGATDEPFAREQVEGVPRLRYGEPPEAARVLADVRARDSPGPSLRAAPRRAPLPPPHPDPAPGGGSTAPPTRWAAAARVQARRARRYRSRRVSNPDRCRTARRGSPPR